MKTGMLNWKHHHDTEPAENMAPGQGSQMRLPAKIQYQYATMPLNAVASITQAQLDDKPGSYLADDAESRALRKLLNAGFRWVRSDGDIAVFERLIRLP